MVRRTTTRERLVRTAGELFWRQGYADTGVSLIIERAGATSGSFYHFFPTKDDLLLAVLESVGEMVDDEVLAVVEASTDDPGRRVAGLAAAYREHARPGAPGFGLPVGALVTELGAERAPARDRVGGIYRSLVDRVAGWLEPTGHRELAELVVGALEGAAVMARAGGDPAPVELCAIQLERWLGLAGGAPVAAPVIHRGSGAGADWRAW